MLDGANWHEAPGKPWPVFYLLTLQVTWPRPGSQVICGVCCLCFLSNFTSHLDPSHLAYFGMHPIVSLAMRC